MTQHPDFVAALLIQNDHLLMVKHQGDDDPAPYWSLPGGQVEAGETARQALIREVREETGLDVVEIGPLAYRVELQQEGRRTEAQVYRVTRWQGSIAPRDPDGKVLAAAFLPLEQAITEFPKIDYRPMSEPPLAYLQNRVPEGHTWRYHTLEDGVYPATGE